MDVVGLLNAHLNSKTYTKVIGQRGREIYDDWGIVWSDFTSSHIEGEVLGSHRRSYYVVLEFKKNGKIEGSCDCPYGEPCKHQVALILQVLEDLGEVDPEPVKSKARVSQKQLFPPDAPVAKSSYPTLSKRSADKVRYLPIDGYEDMEDLLDECRPRRHEYLYMDNTEGRVYEDMKIEAVGYDKDWKGSRTIRCKVDILSDDRGIGVVCHTCSSSTDRLCKHQYHVLMELYESLEETGYFDQTLTFEEVLTNCVGPLGVPREGWDKYLTIKINEHSFFAETIAPNIFPLGWVDKAVNQLDLQASVMTKEREPVSYISLPPSYDQFGYLWLMDPFEIGRDSELRFMSGFGYKTKVGINPKDRVIDTTANLFPAEHQEIADLCFKYCRLPDADEAFTKMRNLFLDNSDELNAVFHYIHTQRTFDFKIDNKSMRRVEFSPSTLSARFSVDLVDGLIEFAMDLEADGVPIKIKDIIYQNRFFCSTNSTIYVFSERSLRSYFKLFEKQDKFILAKQELPGLKLLISDIQRHFRVEVDPKIDEKVEVLSNPTYQIYLQEMDDVILFEPMLSYKEGLVNAFHTGHVLDGIHARFVEPSDRLYLLDFLKEAHPKFGGLKDNDGYLFLEGKDLIRNMWFIGFAEACTLAGVELLGRDQLKKYKYSAQRGTASIRVSSGIDWFGVESSLSFGDEQVKQSAWIQAIQRGENYVQLKDGSYGMLPQEWLEQMDRTLKVAEVKKGAIKISKYRYNIIDDLFAELDDEVMQEVDDRRSRFNNYFASDQQFHVPETITADLRGYQKEGARWLHFLDKTNSGGILADDMGLGKTLQMITLLAAQPEGQTSLVVVPRSLLFNWADELDKFCEPLIYLIHHGPNRSDLMEEIEHAQVIITTYDIVVRDVEMFSAYTFDYIILDESQAIKNPTSKRYKSLRLLKARNRVAMTGTPIENNTFDLYAQLSFTSPGLLGSQASFKRDFAQPIDKNGDKDAAALLKKMIHPFVLRRTKEQVAKDLPKKIEQTIICDMQPAQRKLYDDLRNKIKNDLSASQTKGGGNKGQLRFQILEGLLRLRQMCNAPYLVNSSLGASKGHAIKLDILSEQLSNVTKDHKVLVFSQFVGMLSLIKKVLDRDKIKYAYLDGSTRDRQGEVARFQDDDAIKVFLISLKAGNTGLNLTQADYVYIIDPWWNPAAEAQAIDRTHRIGQDKPVFAYKMICRDTIEEKILELQAKKKALASDIIKVDEDMFKQLDEQSLLELFD